MAWMDEQVGVSFEQSLKWTMGAIERDDIQALRNALELHPRLGAWRMTKERAIGPVSGNVDSLLTHACRHLSLKCAKALLDEKPLSALKKTAMKGQSASRIPVEAAASAPFRSGKEPAASGESSAFDALRGELGSALVDLRRTVCRDWKASASTVRERAVLDLARVLASTQDPVQEDMATQMLVLQIAELAPRSQALATYFWALHEQSQSQQGTSASWARGIVEALCLSCARPVSGGFEFALERLPAGMWAQPGESPSSAATDPVARKIWPVMPGQVLPPGSRPIPAASLDSAILHCVHDGSLNEAQTLHRLDALKASGARLHGPRPWILRQLAKAQEQPGLSQWVQKCWAHEDREELAQALRTPESGSSLANTASASPKKEGVAKRL